MKIKDMKLEDLELIPYDDLAYMILKEENKKMKINELFKKICDILQLSDNEFENKIADFFELISTEKRFVMLEDGYWDLKDNHSQKVIIDDEEEDPTEEIINLEETEEEQQQDIYDETDETDDIEDDDLQDFVVIDNEDEENADI